MRSSMASCALLGNLISWPAANFPGGSRKARPPKSSGAARRGAELSFRHSDSLHVMSPPAEGSDFAGTLRGIGLADESGHMTSVLQLNLPDGQRSRDRIHKTAKPGGRDGPHLDLDGGTSLCDSNHAGPVRRPPGQRVEGISR